MMIIFVGLLCWHLCSWSVEYFRWQFWLSTPSASLFEGFTWWWCMPFSLKHETLSLSYLDLIIYLVSQIMGYKIFTHEIHSSYAARVDNFRSYDTVSKDIIQRWTYPLVPDVQFSGHGSTKLERHGIYRASGNRFFYFFFPVWDSTFIFLHQLLNNPRICFHHLYV